MVRPVADRRMGRDYLVALALAFALNREPPRSEILGEELIDTSRDHARAMAEVFDTRPDITGADVDVLERVVVPILGIDVAVQVRASMAHRQVIQLHRREGDQKWLGW